MHPSDEVGCCIIGIIHRSDVARSSHLSGRRVRPSTSSATATARHGRDHSQPAPTPDYLTPTKEGLKEQAPCGKNQ